MRSWQGLRIRRIQRDIEFGLMIEKYLRNLGNDLEFTEDVGRRFLVTNQYWKEYQGKDFREYTENIHVGISRNVKDPSTT